MPAPALQNRIASRDLPVSSNAIFARAPMRCDAKCRTHSTGCYLHLRRSSTNTHDTPALPQLRASPKADATLLPANEFWWPARRQTR
eukprot:4276248-Prymnesium_polylepis.1